ncbi:ABC transporter ATP-binding protein [Reichenbachiella sp.]
MIIKSLKRTLRIIPKTYHIKSVYLFLGILINSMFDIVGLAAILPILAAVLKKDFVITNPVTSKLYYGFGFQSQQDFILMLCITILLFIIGKNLFGIWIQKTQARFTLNIHKKLSAEIFKRAYSRGFLYFTENNSNKILNRVAGVPLVFAQQLLIQLIQFINELCILVLVLISLLAYDFRILALLTVVVIPFFTIFYQANKKKVAKFNEEINDLIPQITKPVFELTFGYVDVAIGGVFSSFKAQYLKKINQAKSLRIRLLVIQSIPNRLIEISVIMAVITMLLYGMFVLEDVPSILTLLSVFGLAAYRTIPSINRIMLAAINVKGKEYTLNILEELLNGPKISTQEPLGEITFNDNIRLDEISFKFPGTAKRVLNEVSLHIAKRESIGIIGKSGSGKTTLMNIMLGFIEPSSGKLSVDGQVINQENIALWQKKIGYVRQDVFLIDGTLLENVAFGIPEEQVDRNKLIQAIDKAQLTEFVNELPEKGNTNIGERGTKISGGQRQRIGIARALYHGAEILFFDEATSALDSETEHEITESIRSLHESKLTMVIIAHRESTLKYCNRIIKLKSGSIAEASPSTPI